MPYWRIYYHIVWATSRRTPWLEGDAADVAEAAIRSHIHALRGLVHGVAVMPDHVHIACSFSPAIHLSNAIGQIKGRSSNLVRLRHRDLAEEGFSWQGDYGVFSFSERGLPRILDYLQNQRLHHRDDTLIAALEMTDDLRQLRSAAEHG